MTWSYSEQPRLRSWAITTYTANEWIELVEGYTALESIILCNTTAQNIDVQLRLSGALIFKATIFPGMHWIESLPSIPVNAGDNLEMFATGEGIHVTVGGSL